MGSRSHKIKKKILFLFTYFIHVMVLNNVDDDCDSDNLSFLWV